MKPILVAGSTGYLGSHIVQELLNENIEFKAIARNSSMLLKVGLKEELIIQAELTKKESIRGCCEGIDTVISTVGITRQKDGLTYMDVDYQANKNLLEEAIRSGVKKFIYVSVLHGENLTHLKICEAKERFVMELRDSGLEYTIIRPSGFFSDMSAFYQMARKGRVYLFGDGLIKANPIHGADLAKVCIDAIARSNKDIEIGGPEILSHKEIAEIAFDVVGKRTKISYIPNWLRRLMLKLASLFMAKSEFGKTEFFLNVMVTDMSTHRFGQHTLRKFFTELKDKEKIS